MRELLSPHAFRYEHTDIPPGLTIAEWRGHPNHSDRARRLSLSGRLRNVAMPRLRRVMRRRGDSRSVSDSGR